jgi:hypothetical protein
MDSEKIGSGGFLEAGRDAAELLETIDARRHSPRGASCGLTRCGNFVHVEDR